MFLTIEFGGNSLFVAVLSMCVCVGGGEGGMKGGRGDRVQL